MENIQFRTNYIEWGMCKEGYVCPINAYSLKDPNDYGNEITAFIATDLIPNKISYINIESLNHLLDAYEDDLEDNGNDPVSKFAPDGLTESEIDAARVFYMLIKDIEWPEDERNMTSESVMRAYFASPDVSRMNKDYLESVFVELVK